MQKACVRFCQQPSHAAADAMMMWRVFSRIFASFSPKLLDSQSHDNKRPGWRSLRVRTSLPSTHTPRSGTRKSACAGVDAPEAFSSASAHSPPFLPRLANELPHARVRAAVRCGSCVSLRFRPLQHIIDQLISSGNLDIVQSIDIRRLVTFGYPVLLVLLCVLTAPHGS
jgi:hypothetical protein